MASFTSTTTLPLPKIQLKETWGEEECGPICQPVSVPQNLCRNLSGGFCPYGDRCHFSHEYPWMRQAIDNLKKGKAWIVIGDNNKLPIKELKMSVGKIKRIDYVKIPKEYGYYYCAVVHFKSMNANVFNSVKSGRYFPVGNCRVQLFRGKILPKSQIRAKNKAQDAAEAAVKASELALILAKMVCDATLQNPIIMKRYNAIGQHINRKGLPIEVD